MTPRLEVLGDCQLWLGDCRDVLSRIDPPDVIVTDPPYGISHSSNHGATWQRTRIAGDGDTSIRDAIIDGFSEVAAFGTWKTPPIRDAKGALVWDKGPAFGMGDLSFPWKGSWELIYVKGRSWSGSRDEGVLRGHVQVSWESQGRVHPHQKPVSLMASLIRKSPVQAVICDPFMGSGSTGVACVQLGRKFLGIEIDADHFANACARVEAALKQPRLFAEPHGRPQQPSFFGGEPHG